MASPTSAPLLVVGKDMTVPQLLPDAVAHHLRARLEELAAGDEALEPWVAGARWWLSLCDADALADLVIRPIRVLPYGGARESFFGYTRKWLDDHHPINGCSVPMTKDAWAALTEDERAALRLRRARIVVLSDALWDLTAGHRNPSPH